MGIACEEIEFIRGACETASTANDHAMFAWPCGLAPLDLLGHVVVPTPGGDTMCQPRLAHAHEVLARSYGDNDVIMRIASADIESLKGRSTQARVAQAHAIFDKFYVQKSVIRRRDCADIADKSGRLRHYKVAYDQAEFARS